MDLATARAVRAGMAYGRPAMRAGPDDLSSYGAWRPLRCPVSPRRDAVWIAPEGELDVESAGFLRAVLDEHLGTGFPRFVLDLRGLTFIDSTGLKTLIEAKRSAGARDIDLTVRPVPHQVQRIFDITGTADLFPPG